MELLQGTRARTVNNLVALRPLAAKKHIVDRNCAPLDTGSAGYASACFGLILPRGALAFVTAAAMAHHRQLVDDFWEY